MSASRNQFWDVARGLAIVIVVFGHAIHVSTGWVIGGLMLHRIFLNFQMELMFFISGSVALYSMQKPIQQQFAAKFWRLLVPYLFWCSVLYYLRVLIGIYPYSVAGELADIWFSPFWFLRILFLVLVIHIPLTALRQAKYYAIFHVLGVVLAVAVLRYVLPGIDTGRQWSHCLLWFELGYLVALLVKALPRQMIRGVVLAFGVIGLVMYSCGIISSVSTIGGICLAFVITEVICRSGKTSIWVYFGMNSLAIYAIHWIIFYAILSQEFVDFPKLMNGLPTLLQAGLLGVTWLGLSCLLIGMVRRAPKWIGLVLLGEKK